MNAALEKEEKRKRRSRLVVIISVGVLLVLIAVGVTVGVIVAKNNSKEKSSSSGVTGGRTGGGTTGGTGTGPPTAVITGDPSVFKADSRLKKSFYGLAYTPEGSLPDYGCSIQLPNVIQDVQLMSQMTKRIRLYGSDCNQTAMVLEAVKQTKVDLQVFVGNYVVADDHDAYLRQRDAIKEAIETYGTDHIGGVTVGNEFMLNWVVGHNSLDANSAIANQGAAILKADIEDTRDMLAALGHGNMPVGNSDAGSFFNDEIMSSIDYGMSNVHAWFANTTAEAAAAWVNEFFQENNVRPAALLPNKPRMYIAETGWPTASSDAANAHNGPGGGSASVEGLQTFLDTFVCEANANGVGYFFFEFKDEEWKDIKYGGVEGHWGIFDKNKVMKDVVLPDCVAP